MPVETRLPQQCSQRKTMEGQAGTVLVVRGGTSAVFLLGMGHVSNLSHIAVLKQHKGKSFLLSKSIYQIITSSASLTQFCDPSLSTVVVSLSTVPAAVASIFLARILITLLMCSAMHAAAVSIHPLVLAGWCGLTTTAFNLLPVGCLDGGRAMQAAFGKSSLTGFALGTYLLLGLGVLGGPLSLPWGLYILICQRDPEKPCLNDVTEVGTWRQVVFSVTLILVVLILLPLWDGLADDLGVGLGSPLI